MPTVEIRMAATDYPSDPDYIIATAGSEFKPWHGYDGVDNGLRVDDRLPCWRLYRKGGEAGAAGFGAEVKRHIGSGIIAFRRGITRTYYLRVAEGSRAVLRISAMRSPKWMRILTPAFARSPFKSGEQVQTIRLQNVSC